MELKEFKTHFAEGEHIFREGDDGDCAYIIETGLVEVSVQKEERKLVIATLGPGDLLGEMAIIDKLPRTASALALEETQVIAIPLDYIRQKVECSDPTVRFFLEIVLERYRDIHARLMHVFAGIATPSEENYQALYATTTNVVKNLMTQYLELQDRILSAVNTTLDAEDRPGHNDETAWHAKQILESEQALTTALKRDEFCLHYQPIIDLEAKRIVGCEALVRWQHPDKGLLGPGEFIRQMESNDLIIDFGYWIARQACAFLARLGSEAGRPLSVSINLSPRQFEDPDMIAQLDQIMHAAGINPELVRFEITESLLLKDPERANDLLYELKKTGAKLAIDDFGTGYSSFNYLHRFPFDILKIDRAFIGTMVPNRKSRQIVKSLVLLSHDLGMDVVAEGIETSFEEEILVELHAEYGQGFHYSPAVDAAAFLALLG